MATISQAFRRRGERVVRGNPNWSTTANVVTVTIRSHSMRLARFGPAHGVGSPNIRISMSQAANSLGSADAGFDIPK